VKKRNILLSIAIASVSLFSLAACTKQEATPTPTPTATATPTSVVPTEEKYTVNYVTNCSTTIESQKIKKGEKVTEPSQLSKTDSEGRTCEFKGWYTDEKFRNAYDFNTEVTKDITLYAKWFGYEDVNYSIVPEKLTTGVISNKQVSQYLVKNGEVRGRTKIWYDPEDESVTKTWTKSIKNGVIDFTAPGDGKVIIYVQNGSSDAEYQLLSFGHGLESPTKIKFAGTQPFGDYPGGSPVVAIECEVEEGESYTVKTGSGTIDFFEIDMICTVKETDINGFIIENVKNYDYLIGESFDESSVDLLATYENGKTEPIASDDEDVSFELTEFDSSKSGSSKVKVGYRDYEKKEIDVNIYEVESINLGFNKTYLSEDKTLAGNQQYINGKTKLIYALNEELNTDYLSVTAVAKLGDERKEFLINTRESVKNISYDAIDTSTAGEKNVTVNYNDGNKVTTTYKVTVVDTEPVRDTNNNIIVNVNSGYTGVQGAQDATLGNKFTTIGEALEYLGRFASADKKIMTIEKGTYTEKLEITVPNLTINGNVTNPSEVLIEWDSLYDIPDEGGFYQVTDSCQSVSVRETAVNCTINNVTISNWWNSEERFTSDESIELLKKYGLYTSQVNDHRAVALLVQSDKFVMNNTRLLGYQDTVQFQKGRQVLNKCFISGTTDFIFGTNNTTLFNECEIKAINTGKKDGGYTTAFKGCSKGEEDAVKYGAIFYKCNFTCETGVSTDPANTSLGRTWGAYAAVAYIECNMGSHISKKASSGASKNERYVAMQGFTPNKTETIQFVEYGNEGTGAISASQAGVTYLDSTEAAKYHDFTIIFGQTNRNVSYSDAWDPTSLLQ